MLRYILLAAFICIVGVLGYRIADLYMSYKTLSQIPDSQVMGNPDGDLTVVEFLDYSCIYCKQVHPDLAEALERDGNVRYVIRPIALMDAQSVVAIKLLYAAEQQGQFAHMHEALIENNRPLDEAAIASLAERLGLDVQKLLQDTEAQALKDRAFDNFEVFKKLGMQGTPSFVIGYKMHYTPRDQMPSAADFLSMFKEARDLGL